MGRIAAAGMIAACLSLFGLRHAGTQANPAPPPESAQAHAILQRCVACHSEAKSEGRLNLTSRAATLRGGLSGSALVPGRPEESLLFRRVAAKQMPPGNPLVAEEIETLRRWIAAGAAWEKALPPQRAGQDWWALRPLKRPAIPNVRNRQWVRNPIDAFILAKLEAKGLRPAPPAERAALLRRVTYDLLGTPPTPQETSAFLADKSPNAYEKVVERLLADPRYGEKWARRWLDVARFGESHGFERDQIRPNAWPYRDYVVRAFNADKPYAEFVTEQIAGDALLTPTQDSITATGFLVAAPWDEVGHTQVNPISRARVREEEMEEMTGTVGQTFLGMTVNCARCHDHKFDAIPQRDYYRLKAALDGVRHGERPRQTAREKQAHDAQQAALRKRLHALDRECAAIERAGRARVLQAQGAVPPAGLPVPISQWTFETDARDLQGNLHGDLKNGAQARNGRLLLAKGAFAVTDALHRDIREKTFEAWVTLSALNQRGGAVLSLADHADTQFDALVFGEREPGKWIAGSEFFHRTRDLAAPAETALPDTLIHIAAVYGADNRIALYRNGQPYGDPYTPTGAQGTLRAFKAFETVLYIGMRHPKAPNDLLAGEVEEARLYDRALSAQEIAASFRAGFANVGEAAMLRALTGEERRRRAALQAERGRRQAALRVLEQVARVYAAVPQQPEPTAVLARGDVEQPGERVAAGGLTWVRTIASDWNLAPDAPEAERRRQLAAWITHPQNPLSWRVIVNRVWHYHFGRGIVGTPSDFGWNGERPTHPELLDWLADAFRAPSEPEGGGQNRSKQPGRIVGAEQAPPRRSKRRPYACGGRLKALHRIILLSNAYRQSARYDAKAAMADAENRLLWRFPPRRLEAEEVRDAMLCVSGQINYRRGGPGFRPFTVTISNSHFYTLTDPDTPEFNRRSLYRISVHSAKSPLLEALDCPDPSTKTPTRTVTTTPLQAMQLMNSPFALRQSRYFAARLEREARNSLPRQIALAYRLAFGRAPSAEERTRAAQFAGRHGLESLCWTLLNATEFLTIQ